MSGMEPFIYGAAFVLVGTGWLKIFWRSVSAIPALHVNKRRLPASLPAKRKTGTSALILQENYHEQAYR